MTAFEKSVSRQPNDTTQPMPRGSFTAFFREIMSRGSCCDLQPARTPRHFLARILTRCCDRFGTYNVSEISQRPVRLLGASALFCVALSIAGWV